MITFGKQPISWISLKPFIPGAPKVWNSQGLDIENHRKQDLGDRIKKIQFYLSRIGFVFFLAGHFLLYLVRYTLPGRLLLLVVLAAGLIYYALFQPPGDISPGPEELVTVNIPAGATFRQVSDSLKKADLLRHEQAFLLLGKISRKTELVRFYLYANLFVQLANGSLYCFLVPLDTATGDNIPFAI